MKRICFVLSALLVFACLSMTAAAADDMTLSIPNISVLEGSEFTIPVNISNNSGICGLDITVSYDTALEFISVTSTNGFDSILEYSAENGILNIACHRAISDGNYTGNGAVLNLNFALPAQTNTDSFSFEITSAQTTDYNENLAEPVLKGGTASIMAPLTFAGADIESVKVGEIFEYTVFVNNNIGFANVVMSVSYDSAKLEYIPYGSDTLNAVGNLVPASSIFAFNETISGNVVFGLMGIENISTDGALVTFRFKALTEFASEPIDIEITDISDQNGTALVSNTQNGSITSEAEQQESETYVLGDANGDNAITAGDAATILQGVAKIIAAPEANTIEFAAWDANKDGGITAGDAAAVLQYVAKILTDTEIGTELEFTAK